MPKKKTKKKKTNGSVGGKADVHAHEEGKRNKSFLILMKLKTFITLVLMM